MEENTVEKKPDMGDNQLKFERSLQNFMIKKYAVEIIILILLLSAVCFARYNAFIDNCVTGTLLGTIIGYFAADIRKIHN